MKGRVVVLKEYLKPFVIEEYEVPDPEPGATVLRITQAGICGSDLHRWRGDQVNVPLPDNGFCAGHEGTGVIEKLGPGVTTDWLGQPIKEGDRLMYAAIKPCQRCYQCINGNQNWCSGPQSPRATPITTTSVPTSRCLRCLRNCQIMCSASLIAPWAR